ncbi:hypothetical protein MMC28_007609 [Mycoblastus sanguinarius]|nr:hypothetical protein [Mycoblastus sanguinarius]
MRSLPLTIGLTSLALLPTLCRSESPTYSPTTTACSAFPTKVNPVTYYTFDQDTPTKVATNSTNVLTVSQGSDVTHQADSVAHFTGLTCPTGPYSCDYYLVFDWVPQGPNYNEIGNDTSIDVFYFTALLPTSNGIVDLTWDNAAAITGALIGSFTLPGNIYHGYGMPLYQLTYINGIDCNPTIDIRLSITNGSYEAGSVTYQGGGAMGGLSVYHGAAFPS